MWTQATHLTTLTLRMHFHESIDRPLTASPFIVCRSAGAGLSLITPNCLQVTSHCTYQQRLTVPIIAARLRIVHTVAKMVDSTSTDICRVQPYQLQPTDSWPSNATLPILHYKPIEPPPFRSNNSLAEHFEELLPQHQWQPQWRYAMFKQHHFHSTVHECLCIFSGQAHVQLGAEDPNTNLDYDSPYTKNLTVERGDVVVLPVGTGHHLVSSSRDFSMVGAYPDNAPHCDMNHIDDSNKQMNRIQARIQKVPLPKLDPVQGKRGPMVKLWQL